MYRRFLYLLLIGCFSIAFSDSAIQTDWSGEAGNWGPVMGWGSNFLSNTSLDGSVPGCLAMGYFQLEHQIAYSYSGAVRSVHASDFDGDGDMDAVVGFGHSLVWFENKGGYNPQWEIHTLRDEYISPSLCSGDIDGDGDFDILSAASNYSNEIDWWENLGEGDYWWKHVISFFETPNSVTLADLDGDGDLDAVASRRWAPGSGTDIAWWENVNPHTDTTWTEHQIVFDQDYTRCIHADDINGDGLADILSVGGEGITWFVNWFENPGSGDLWVKHPISWNDGLCDVSSCDIDGDGDTDVIGTHAFGVSWWEYPDWIEHPVPVDSLYKTRHISLGDVNCDNDQDILLTYETIGPYCRVSWLINSDGSGSSWEEAVVGQGYSSPHCLGAFDIDGDGDTDALGESCDFHFLSWWELGFRGSGILESSCLYLQNDPGWGLLSWSSNEPPGTGVAFQIRACDSPDSPAIGAWSDTLFTPGSIQGILSEGDSYFQYRAILLRDASAESPVLDDVTVLWLPQSTGSSSEDGYQLFPVTPNPTMVPEVKFFLPEPSAVDLTVFDLTGRIVKRYLWDLFVPGTHGVLFEDLTAGIYFCRMISGDFISTQRFVVIE